MYIEPNDHLDSNNTPQPVPKEQESSYFADLSGPSSYGRPKARILVRYCTLYSDGGETEHQALMFEKPILSLFKHAGFVNVRMDFGQVIDQDLLELWSLLEEYSSPLNSVSYTPEELESGYFRDAQGEHLVYFPIVDLTLSPISNEKAYAMSGINPAFYTLQPNGPGGEACVIQLTFPEDCFSVITSLDLDYDEIQQETMQELGLNAQPEQ